MLYSLKMFEYGQGDVGHAMHKSRLLQLMEILLSDRDVHTFYSILLH